MFRMLPPPSQLCVPVPRSPQPDPQPPESQRAPAQRPQSRPETLSATNSDMSVRTISSMCSMSSWDMVSERPTRAPTPAPPSPRRDHADDYMRERDASAARIGVLMAGAESQRMRQQLLASPYKPSKQAMNALLRIDTTHLHYYRDLMTSGRTVQEAVARQMWRDAIKPVLDDTHLYAREPALRCCFLNQAYAVCKSLREHDRMHERLWLVALRDLAGALTHASRMALDKTMEAYLSADSEGDTITEVARSYINVERWRDARRAWKAELRSIELLEASLHTLASGCRSASSSSLDSMASRRVHMGRPRR